jgi:hypothetical protein
MYVHTAGSIQLNSINATAYVQRSATVSKRKSSAHFIAMAEMVVVHNAQYWSFAAPSGTFNLERNTTAPPE